jgi:hypothetical protein
MLPVSQIAGVVLNIGILAPAPEFRLNPQSGIRHPQSP